MNVLNIFSDFKYDKKFLIQFVMLCFIACLQIYSIWHQAQTNKSVKILDHKIQLQQKSYRKVETNLNNLKKDIFHNQIFTQNELEGVDQKLALIQNNINNHASKEDVENLKNEVVQLKSLLMSKKSDAIIENKEMHQTQSSSNLSEAVSDTENSNKMTHAKKRVSSHPVYLSPHALPFHVSSIDIWNGTPEATIYHGYSADLMEKNEVRDGWQLVHLSFDSGEVVFQNKHHQRVRVCLL
jgi:hypothetical protein